MLIVYISDCPGHERSPKFGSFAGNPARNVGKI